jgi:predicted O-methyltransferase YrrM
MSSNNKANTITILYDDHTYEGVKKDFEMYSPLVREGGIVAFHDIVPGLHEYVGGVPRFWREVKSNYVSKEIVKDWNQGGFGIGVIRIDKSL